MLILGLLGAGIATMLSVPKSMTDKEFFELLLANGWMLTEHSDSIDLFLSFDSGVVSLSLSNDDQSEELFLYFFKAVNEISCEVGISFNEDQGFVDIDACDDKAYSSCEEALTHTIELLNSKLQMAKQKLLSVT